MKNIRRNVASILAVVFVWLVIGTLVNFHQHHVFGKVLIFHVSSTITLKKDEQQATFNLRKSGFDCTGWAMILPEEFINTPLSSHPNSELSDCIPSILGGQSQIILLRGPPRA